MAKEDAKVVISGDASGLFKTLGDSSKAVKGMAKEMEGAAGGLKNLLMGFTAPLAALAAVVGGKEFLKGTVEETKNWTVEAQKLSRVLNITTEAASVLNLAIGDIYGTQEEYLGAVAKLTKSLNGNEEAFHRLGVATRDQNGAFRDTPTIMAEVNAALAKIEGGTARNVASAQIYGKSWMEVQRYLKLTPDVIQAAQEKAEKLNLIVGQDAVEATNAYRASMNDLEDTVKALKLRLGTELMPVMTQWNTILSDAGPSAVTIISGGFKTFTRVCSYLSEGLLNVVDTYEFTIDALKTSGGAFGSFMKALWNRDAKGMADSIKNFQFQASIKTQVFRDSLAANAALMEAQRAKLDGWNGNSGPQQPAARGGLGPQGGGSKEGADPYAAFEAQMKAEAAVRKERLALWDQHQNDLFEVFGNEQDREERKINQHHDAMLQHARAFGAEQAILDQIEVEREVALQNARTEAAAKAAEKRREIRAQEREDERRALEATGTAQQGFLDGIDQYLQRQGSTFQQWALRAQQLLQGVENVFARTMQGILTGQIRGTQILRALWQGLSGAIIQVLAQMVAKWLVATLAAKIFKDTASDAAKENAVAQQQAAASTLWATYAGIPFAGPALAAGFIALMNASLIANAASAKGIVGAAAGGWFDRPTLTMIGEGTRPELVVPDVAFRDFAGNLAQNILAQERQAQAYGRQAAGFASARSLVPAGVLAGGAGLTVQIMGHVLGESSESGRIIGERVWDVLQDHQRRNS